MLVFLIKFFILHSYDIFHVLHSDIAHNSRKLVMP